MPSIATLYSKSHEAHSRLGHPARREGVEVILLVLGLAILIVVAALSGAIQGDFRGEEFAVIHNANSYDHFTAWRNYVYEVGRPIAVAYWIYSYEIIGYNPLLAHSLSFLLVLLSAVIGALCFRDTWPKTGVKKYVVLVLIILFFFNWVSMERGFILSSDQSHLSMLLFFLSGLTLQRWAIGGARGIGWLLASFLLFALCLLTYEAASFLFPALLLLAWPLLPKRGKEQRKKKIRTFLALGIASELFFLLPYLVYSFFTPYRSHLLGNFDLAFVVSTATNFFSFLKKIGLWLGHPFAEVSSFVFLLTLFGVTIITVWALRKPKEFSLDSENRERFSCVYLACGVLIIGGILPFALTGIAGTRVYHAVVFGLPPLLLIGFDLARKDRLRRAWAILIAATLFLGLNEFKSQSALMTQTELSENSFYIGMKEAVPFVKPETVFIFVDRALSSSGCGPSFNMLYNQVGLQCAFFSSDEMEFRATRYSKEIIAHRGGRLNTENWIIIRTDENGIPHVVPEIRFGDFDLIINWVSMKPIKTDYARIKDDFLPPPSDFYLYLLLRREALIH